MSNRNAPIRHILHRSIGSFLLGLGMVSVLGWASAVGAADLFVTSPIYALNPDGTAADIVGGSFGNLAAKNGHWDAATKTVTLTAAKNEEVAVQVVIPAEGTKWSAEVSDLAGAGTIKASQATFSAILWSKAGATFFNDVVIPLDGSVAGLNSYDEFLLYDGTKVGFDGALAGRRVKLWRDSINDFDYVAQARAKDPLATRAVIERMTFVAALGGENHAKVASIASNNNPESYLAARRALADIIAGRKVDAQAIPGRSKDFMPASENDKITNYD